MRTPFGKLRPKAGLINPSPSQILKAAVLIQLVLRNPVAIRVHTSSTLLEFVLQCHLHQFIQTDSCRFGYEHGFLMQLRINPDIETA